MNNIADRMRTDQHKVDTAFMSKIEAIRHQFLKDDPGFGAVILIGVNDSEPLTILDGNHRFVAALLSTPTRLKSIRFLCGLSPRMTECCWYNTSFATLCRYAKNVAVHATRNPETELARLLEETG